VANYFIYQVITQTIHICQLPTHNSIAMSSLKTFYPAGFEPGSSAAKADAMSYHAGFSNFTLNSTSCHCVATLAYWSSCPPPEQKIPGLNPARL
jgi:hypothetical protein